MWSPNGFADAWTMWVYALTVLAVLAGAMTASVVVWHRRNSRILALLAAGAVVALGVAVFLVAPSFVGRYTQLYRVRAGDREIPAVLTHYSVGGRGGSHEGNHLLAFDLATGRPLGRVTLPSGTLNEPKARLVTGRGTQAVVATREGYLIVDLASARVVGRQRSRAVELGPYRTTGFDQGRWTVTALKQDGRTAVVSLGTPPAGPVGEIIDPDGTACGTWTRSSGKGLRDRYHGLLRVIELSAQSSDCRFPSGGEAFRLYLHRATAFDSGAYLLSALTDEGRELWRLDLSAHGDPKRQYEILLAELAGPRLRLLVGAGETIYWFLVDPWTGSVVGSRALY